MQELTTQDFHGALAKANTIVDFWAPWCGPCRLIAPVLEDLAKSHAGVVFAKVNVDEQPQIAQEFGIRSIPTLVLFKNGQEASRIVGLVSKQQLESKMRDTFK